MTERDGDIWWWVFAIDIIVVVCTILRLEEECSTSEITKPRNWMFISATCDVFTFLAALWWSSERQERGDKVYLNKTMPMFMFITFAMAAIIGKAIVVGILEVSCLAVDRYAIWLCAFSLIMDLFLTSWAHSFKNKQSPPATQQQPPQSTVYQLPPGATFVSPDNPLIFDPEEDDEPPRGAERELRRADSFPRSLKMSSFGLS